MHNEHDMPALAPQADDTDIDCRGCGTCCRKGGPALHTEDLALFRAGHLAPEYCLTLRAGELARDLNGQLRPLERELVKLRPRMAARNGDWTCLFLNQSDNRCGVYAHRPAECRALLCRDTWAIKTLHAVDRVTRLDVLAAWAEGEAERAGAAAGRTDVEQSGLAGPPDSAVPADQAASGGCAAPGVPWADILAAHEERCGYAVLAATGAALQRAADNLRARNPGMAHPMPLSEASDGQDSPPRLTSMAGMAGMAEAAPAVATFLEAVRFDFAFRSIVRERAGVAMEELDFLLGRTLAATAAMYGVAVRMGADGPELVVLPSTGI
ncbi:YkgJ family cysteine cluster protein [Nitratidesulfovibrio liaohensis]|uniref:YkgJ family cysteine cluster protein n=1 Tax=Nitratidesulfovibrio liaohensis TaxID=2604158 RepID=A0ABY9QZR2_9BACT|nr:YkgJ family cysteine cluster protein [Nitratidesulfovibrio liaohensis]WMW64004.1 YkgJ family cysteine cluster protein [Nitratidesulfovibrio liaohensis]